MLDFINFNTSICCALYAILIYLVTGYVIGSLFVLKNIRRPGLAIIKLIIGMDIITVSGYLLGYYGLLNSKILIIMLSSISLTGIIILIFKHKSELKIKKITLKKYSPLFIALSLFPLMLGRALCLPAGWDELTYQLALPARWIQAGYIAVFQDNPFSAFPSAASVNFYILMMTGGILVPRLFVLFLWIISAISLYILIKPGFSKWFSSIITFSFASTFSVIMAATSAYTELFILVQVAGIILLFRNLSSAKSICYVLGFAGFLAGIAASVKLTGLIVGVAFFIYILIIKYKNNLYIKISDILAYLLTFASTAIIFYARPYSLTGNPLYPYFSCVFGNELSSMEMSRYHHLIGSIKYGIHGLSAFFTVPFLLAISPGTFDGGFGWQFVVIFSLSIFSAIIAIRTERNNLIAYVSIAFIFYSFWFFTSQQSRFLLPAIFILFILSKYALCKIPNAAGKYLVLSVLVLSIISIPVNIMKDCLLSWQSVLGSIKTADYLYSATGGGYLKAIHMANAKLPQDAKLMLVFENRGFYIDKNYVIGTPFFQAEFFTPPEQITEPSQIMAILKQNKITHVLIGLSESDPDRLSEYLDRTASFAKMLGSLIETMRLKKIWEDEGFGVYEVEYSFSFK
jgi:hypothetical protein